MQTDTSLFKGNKALSAKNVLQPASPKQGAREERERIVRWLRDIRDDENPPTLFKAAAMIENGEHLTP